jgi:hypothetical protein
MIYNAFAVYIKNITQHRSSLRFPSEEDLNGAAVALLRLQDTYKLDTHALAEGKVLGRKSSRQLTGKQSKMHAKLRAILAIYLNSRSRCAAGFC